jgi:AcrR family transcriptional regulator
MARSRSFDEGEVLRAARDQFWWAGHAAARVDDIAAATGLGKGSLYGAFGDKHQLFLRTFHDRCAGLIEAVRRALDGPDAVHTAGLSPVQAAPGAARNDLRMGSGQAGHR